MLIATKPTAFFSRGSESHTAYRLVDKGPRGARESMRVRHLQTHLQAGHTEKILKANRLILPALGDGRP